MLKNPDLHSCKDKLYNLHDYDPEHKLKAIGRQTCDSRTSSTVGCFHLVVRLFDLRADTFKCWLISSNMIW